MAPKSFPAFALIGIALAGCGGPVEARIVPNRIGEDLWAESLRVEGLHPTVYLRARGPTLTTLDPLTVRIGGVDCVVTEVGSHHLAVRLTAPLAPGQHNLVVTAQQDSHRFANALSVTVSGTIDGGALGDAATVDATTVDAATVDAATMDAGPLDGDAGTIPDDWFNRRGPSGAGSRSTMVRTPRASKTSRCSSFWIRAD